MRPVVYPGTRFQGKAIVDYLRTLLVITQKQISGSTKKITNLMMLVHVPSTNDDASSVSDTDGEAGSSKVGGGTIGTGSKGSAHESEQSRDEVKEIQKMSRMETRLIRTWRVILLVMLVITAAAVSSITYVLLRREENAAYKATVRTLSTTSARSKCSATTRPPQHYSHYPSLEV